MLGTPPLINIIRELVKLPNNLWKVLLTDISDGIPCLFVLLWHCFGLETQRGDQHCSWSSQIILWLQGCDSHIFQTSKFQWNVQGDVLVTTLDISVFTNITTTTIVHVHSCELTKCELFLTCELSPQECLLSGATMINRRWLYNL